LASLQHAINTGSLTRIKFPGLRLLYERRIQPSPFIRCTYNNYKRPCGAFCTALPTASIGPIQRRRNMPQDERTVHSPVRHKRSLPASYLDGAVPVATPRNPSTPVDKSCRRPVPFVPLYTGQPIKLDNEIYGTTLSSSEYELSPWERTYKVAFDLFRLAHLQIDLPFFAYWGPNPPHHTWSLERANYGQTNRHAARHPQAQRTQQKRPMA
jgi:hypothetical protein